MFLTKTQNTGEIQGGENHYNTINSNTLANELVNLKINNHHRLLTLDIKDLYVNIPIQETLVTTKVQLNAHNDKKNHSPNRNTAKHHPQAELLFLSWPNIPPRQRSHHGFANLRHHGRNIPAATGKLHYQIPYRHQNPFILHQIRGRYLTHL